MTAREAAVRALLACEQKGAWSDLALDALLRRDGLEQREAALAYRIAAGVIQNRIACDWYLAPYLRGKLQPAVKAILRSAVYQIAFLDRVPERAAVNEAVELAKKLANPAAAGLVNAVLRRFSAKALPELPAGEDAESLSIRYSRMKEWTEYFLERLGPEKTRMLLESDNTPPGVTLRVNRLKAEPDTAIRVLQEDGAHPAPLPPLSDFIKLDAAGDLTRLRAFREGLVTVQDTAAALPVLAAEAVPGLRVLDGCAAPGGKSFLLAQTMGDKGSIVACDIQEAKLLRIREGAKRLGVQSIETRLQDARTPPPEFTEAFDLVLADAPCSGLGVIRKKPEIRYRSMAEVAHLPVLQAEILAGLAACVKPGGTLLYATCTLVQAENRDVVSAFLRQHPEFVRQAFCLPAPWGTVADGELTVWPFENQTDGFFLCKMRKRT